MSNNIDFIRKGGTDTSDATATANDIIAPKTAYVDNEKITGSVQTEMLQTSLFLDNQTIKLQANNNFVLDYDIENNIVISATTNNNITAFNIKTESINKDFMISDTFEGYSYLAGLTFVRQTNSNEIQLLCLILDANNNCRIALLCLDKSLNIIDIAINTSVNLPYTVSCSMIYNFTKDVYTIITNYKTYDEIIRITLCKISNKNINILLNYQVKFEDDNVSDTVFKYVYGSWSPNGEYLSLMLEFFKYPYKSPSYGFAISIFNSTLAVVSNYIIGNTYRLPAMAKYKRTFLNNYYVICGNTIYNFNNNSLQEYKTINLSQITNRNIYDYDIVLNESFYIYFSINNKEIYIYSFDDSMNFTYIKAIPFNINIADIYNNRTLAEAKFYIENGVKYSEDNIVKILYTTSESLDFASLERNAVKYYNTSDANTSSSNLLEGKIAYGQNGKMVGTMPNNGELNYMPSTSTQSIPSGYTSGGTINGDTNLIADNIKKDIEIFGVTGTYEGTSGGVKLFETQEEMQADTNASEGDLAIVYRNEINNMTADTETQYIIFPETVTLPTAVTQSYSCVLKQADTSSGYFDGQIMLSSSYFDFMGYSDTSTISVQYSSTDGVNYTRTTFQGDTGYLTNPADLGVLVCCEMSEEWDNNFGYFMQVDENTFEGLYEYNGAQYYLAPTQLTTTENSVFNSVYYGQDGVKEGSLTQNVSNSFADMNAEIYSEIQQAYNNMESRVLTDTDKEIDKNIYIVPTNANGEPLLDTSQVTTMNNMFDGCTNLQEVPLLNTSNVTDMKYMFYSCSSLTTIPLLNTNNVTNMTAIFGNCTNLQEVPLLNTSNVTDMEYMFNSCTNLQEIPQLDISGATDIRYMFNRCVNLQTVPSLNMSSVTAINQMFNDCTSLSNDSLNNILASLLTATSYTSGKTLSLIGLSEEQAATCTTLSNWSACESAGWTTGYSE